MPKAVALALVVLMVALEGCRTTTQDKVTEIDQHGFKILVRSREFNNSGAINIDICVTESSAREFPKNSLGCIMHGYDISGLTVKWDSDREISIALDCGRITAFNNFAVVAPPNALPLQFHATLQDHYRCAAPDGSNPRVK